MSNHPFHACATCIHYTVDKTDKGVSFRCSRLGFATNPKYQFNCWTPKENVVQLMKKRGFEKEGDFNVSS
ncbi:hypothetical protein [Bacillus suaedaesalsae]|uniref:Uncharacterized protein n=1 Tax=Bacillus suaedaesalsae TaxID=2810349 RepID=A0ABS2DLD6_9BACI|nr:hypothetical protein [Bacillus suaedaesalsae]MBM6619310.1 hypothetical protein [Bacillus suaedaesalsae]